MFKKPIYKYRNLYGEIIISPYKPDEEYEEMYRLIVSAEDYILTNYTIFTQVVDIPVKDLELWVEVHKDDLETPISQNEDVINKIDDLNVLSAEHDMMIIENAVQIAIIQLMM